MCRIDREQSKSVPTSNKKNKLYENKINLLMKFKKKLFKDWCKYIYLLKSLKKRHNVNLNSI